jgi:hypothetical protein
MTLAKAKAKTNEIFIVQVSLMIVTYDRKNMFIVQATEYFKTAVTGSSPETRSASPTPSTWCQGYKIIFFFTHILGK